MKLFKQKNKLLRSVLIFAFWIAVWEGISIAVGSELLLPSPIDTFKVFISLLSEDSFYLTVLFSLLRILSGYAVGVILGIAFGTLTAKIPLFETVTLPIYRLIKATPISSFILLVLLWLSTGMVPVFITVLVVVPVIQTAVYEGIKSIDSRLLEMADFFSLSKIKKLKYVYFESIKSRLIQACVMGIAFAWKSGVAAEVLATPKYSIGAGLYAGKLYLETPRLFAYTAVVILFSYALEKLIINFSEKAK